METLVSIVNWEEAYKQDYIDLSVDWLVKYDLLEPADYAILEHPHEAVLDKGGMIFFARFEGKNIGTISMIPLENGAYEAAKLCVSEQYKRRHIGDALMKKAIRYAESQCAKQIILFTNSKLVPAICLYRKHGFIEVAHTDSFYGESDMKMVLELAADSQDQMTK